MTSVAATSKLSSSSLIYSLYRPSSRPLLRAVCTQMQPRIRFNARARQSSHKKNVKREKVTPNEGKDQSDPNASIVIPKSEQEKEQERKLKMREEVQLVCNNLPELCLVDHQTDACGVQLQSKFQEKEEAGQIYC